MRMRWPSRVPGLMRTSSDSVRSTRPSPWQTLHTVRFLPLPPQRGHGMLNFMLPLFCVICPLPLHSRTDAGTLDVALPMTVPADLQMRDAELHHRAPDRVPKANVHLVFEVAARLGALLHRLAASAAEDAGEDVAESAATGPAAAAPAPSEKSLKSKPLKSKGTSCV